MGEIIAMKPSEALDSHRDAVRAIVARYGLAGARVFGSAARNDDRVDSDLDLLVEPTDQTSLLDLGGVQAEVSELLGVRVQVLTPASLPEPWRGRVLKQAQPL